MIKNKDRSGWFGASDTSYIMGNWNTPTFQKWWLVKCGITENNFSNVYTEAGNAYEHRIAKTFCPNCKLDRQIKIRAMRLRVNLDAEIKDGIIEIKTVKDMPTAPKLNHLKQVHVQMLATGLHGAYIVYYNLTDDDYKNFFNGVDRNRIKAFTAWFDDDVYLRFTKQYISRLKYLNYCLRKGVMPNEADLREGKTNYGLRGKFFDFAVARLLRKQKRGTGAYKRGSGEVDG